MGTLVILTYYVDGSGEPEVDFVTLGRPGAMPDSKHEPELELKTIQQVLEKTLTEAEGGRQVKVWHVTNSMQTRLHPPIQGQRD